jgi:hypothetical protein
LSPRRADRLADLDETANYLILLQPKSATCAVEEFALLYGEHFQSAARSGVEQGFAKEFSVGSMNESVGGQNSREIGERLSGGEKKTAALEFIALLLKTRLRREDRLTGEFPGLYSSARDDVMSFRRRPFLRGVIGLPEFEREGVDEVRASAHKDAGGAIFS